MVANRIVKATVAGIVTLGAGPIAAVPVSASTHHAHHHTRSAPRRRSGGIPQHNGGDRDADNNGGPSDGDGDF